MYKRYVKRILDIIFSLILLIGLSPLIILTGLIVYLELGKPIVFTQKREGKNKKPFTMYKFRTMDFNEEETRENRMTKKTKFLDKYRFNELLQLINVLKGDMSLVGPRPFIPHEPLPKSPEKERYLIRPGITGLAQAKGGRNISHEKKLEYDVIYYKNISFLLDLKIVIMTPISMLKENKIS